MADNNQDFIQVLLEKIEKDDLPTNVFDVEGTDPLVLLGKMNEIIGQLENFQSSVNTSNSTANEALSKAEDAVDTSGQALSNANTALGTANQAIGTANQAIGTANQALETAQEAEDVAGQALSNSNTALNTANTAIDTANTALGTANTALSTSQSANTTSSQALDTANTANATANSALESAGTANTTAETAKNIAETANQNSNEAVTTANEAKGIADSANQNSGQAVTTANEAKSTAENALEQVTQGLGTKVYDNAGNLLNQTTFTGENGVNVDMQEQNPNNFVISLNNTITNQIEQNKNNITQLNNDVSELNQTANSALTTANGAVSKNTQQDDSISALQTADGQNVKLTGDQRITGIKNFTDQIKINGATISQNGGKFIINQSLDVNGLLRAKNGHSDYAYAELVTDNNRINGYMRYSSGIQLCWGTITNEGVINFPVPFEYPPTIICGIINTSASNQISYRTMSAYNISASSFEVQLTGSSKKTFLAIGIWK